MVSAVSERAGDLDLGLVVIVSALADGDCGGCENILASVIRESMPDSEAIA